MMVLVDAIARSDVPALSGASEPMWACLVYLFCSWCYYYYYYYYCYYYYFYHCYYSY